MPIRRSAASQRGFSIAEVALGFIIVMVFLAGVLVPLSSYLQNARLAENQRTLELIRDRMVEFLVQNGRLPCPARPDLSAGSNLGREWVIADVGRQLCDGAGDVLPYNPAVDLQPTVSGVVPWITLRVPESDPWGRRFTYSVDRSWAEIDPNCNPVGTRFQPGCTRVEAGRPSLMVASRPNPGVSQLQFDRLAAVVVSHGPNGTGGYRTNGAPAALATPSSDEEVNQLTMPTITTVTRKMIFRTRTPTPARASCDDSSIGGPFCEFDDQIVTLSQSQLAPRLIDAGHVR